MFRLKKKSKLSWETYETENLSWSDWTSWKFAIQKTRMISVAKILTAVIGIPLVENCQNRLMHSIQVLVYRQGEKMSDYRKKISQTKATSSLISISLPSSHINFLSLLVSHSPETKQQRPIPQPRIGSNLRPAVSLAQLCDLDDSSETPSSHKLIERWESIIQENQQRERSYNINWKWWYRLTDRRRWECEY